MSQSILSQMQAIEVEAQQVLDQIQMNIQDNQQSLNNKLKESLETFDLETKEMVEKAREKFRQKEQELFGRMEAQVESNRQQLEAGLSDKKDRLIDYIVEKVVAEYGNL